MLVRHVPMKRSKPGRQVLQVRVEKLMVWQKGMTTSEQIELETRRYPWAHCRHLPVLSQLRQLVARQTEGCEAVGA